MMLPVCGVGFAEGIVFAEVWLAFGDAVARVVIWGGFGVLLRGGFGVLLRGGFGALLW